MSESGIVDAAEIFAASAHKGQLYAGEPYIYAHLAKVVEVVKGLTDDPDAIVIAWLHDVLEDTKVTVDQLDEWVGHKITEQVVLLSRKDSEEEYLKQLTKLSESGKLVKLADIIVNLGHLPTYKGNKRAYGDKKILELKALFGYFGGTGLLWV